MSFVIMIGAGSAHFGYYSSAGLVIMMVCGLTYEWAMAGRWTPMVATGADLAHTQCVVFPGILLLVG